MCVCNFSLCQGLQGSRWLELLIGEITKETEGKEEKKTGGKYRSLIVATVSNDTFDQAVS